MHVGIFRVRNELYTRDLLIINFCSSALGSVALPLHKSCQVVLAFLFKTKACNLSFEFMECCKPEL